MGASMGKLDTVTYAALMLCVSSPIMAESTPQIYAPISPWRMNEEETSCVLERDFGAPATISTLRIEQYAPGSDFLLRITGPAAAGLTERYSPELAFNTVATPGIIRGFFSGTFQDKSGKSQPMFVATASPYQHKKIPAPLARDALGLSNIALSGDLVKLSWAHQAVVLQAGPLKRALAAMDSCVTKLVDHWGLDSKAQESRQRPVLPKRLQMSYPFSKISSGERGLVGVVLAIDGMGKPTSCLISISYADKLFNQQVCKGLAASKFDPALDATGKPFSSFYSTWVYFGEAGDGSLKHITNK